MNTQCSKHVNTYTRKYVEFKKNPRIYSFFFKLTHCNLISCILHVPIRANVCVNQVHVPNFADYEMPCYYNPCLNGGTCDDTNYPSYTCSCPTGWTGQDCSRK